MTVGVTVTLDEEIALCVLRDLARDQRDMAVTDEYRASMRAALAMVERVLASVERAQGSGDCERCYVERARIVKLLNEQLLDERTLSTPGGATDAFSQVRDAGYRAGWNDRARSLGKELAS